MTVDEEAEMDVTEQSETAVKLRIKIVQMIILNEFPTF